MSTRHSFGGSRTYPGYAPRVPWNRLLHRTVLGPLLGCSCSRCFVHPRRLYYWREGVRDRLRVAKLEARVRALEISTAAREDRRG